MPTELTGKFNPKWFSTGRQRRGAWTHALHTHADEINNDGNGPTNGRARARGALEQPLRPGGARAGARATRPDRRKPSRRLRHSRPATLRGHRHRQELGKSTTGARHSTGELSTVS